MYNRSIVPKNFKVPEELRTKDFIKVDTLSVANVKWKESLNDSLVLVKEGELLIWLKQALKTDKVSIKRD